jgi:hypothetical protein
MNTVTKWAIGIATTAAGVLVGRKLLTLNSLSNNLLIDVSGRVHKFTIYPPLLILAIDAVAKNPSSGQVTVKQPVASLFASEADRTANNPLMSSTPENVDFKIPKSGTVKFNPILLTVPAMAVVQLGKSLVVDDKLSLFYRVGTLISGAVVKKDGVQSFTMPFSK